MNQITTTCSTGNGRWLLTADKGIDSVIIVWDTRAINSVAGIEKSNAKRSKALELEPINAAPIKTIFNPHNGAGIVAASFSVDSKYLATLGNGIRMVLYQDSPQTLCVWNWTSISEEPLVKIEVQGDAQVTFISSFSMLFDSIQKMFLKL